MTTKYNNVYLNEVALVTGPYEKNGPLQSYYDKSYNDFYFGTNTWEDAEIKLISESIDLLLYKIGKTRFDIDLLISGDLLNQIVASNYASSKLGIPYLGIYSACASSMEGLIIASLLIDSEKIDNAICSVSSHNNAAEKQFRYPVEYGGPKPKTTTFTSTGGVSAYVSSDKTDIKIESSTIGSVVDMGVTDAYHMGAVMAPAAAQTIYKHFIDTGRNADYYDLILTGDLGIYGKNILKDFMKTEYNIELNNYNDAATMLYDYDKQDVYAGASGPVCLPLVAYGYILSQMKKKKLKKVLLVATGALMNTTMVNEKHSIPSIAHLISLEAV